MTPAKATAPEGFEVTPYPRLEPGPKDTVTSTDVDLFVCTVCKPQWDTFDRAAAEAHTAAGKHYPAAEVIA